MTYNYVVTAHKPTTVVDSAAGNFTSSTDLNLAIAKNTQLEIYVVKPEGLKPFKEFNIYGRIAVIQLFRMKNCSKDRMFMLTEKYDASILEWQGDENGKMVTLAHGNVQERVGRPAETGMISLIDPDCRCICLRLYDGNLKIIPLDLSSSELTSYVVKIDQFCIIDMKFLHSCFRPSIIMVYQDNHQGRHVKMCEIDLKEQEIDRNSSDLSKQETVEAEASIVIAIPPPYLGAVVVGQESITYHKNDKHLAIAPPLIKQSPIVSHGQVDPKRCLLGDMSGRLFVLILEVLDDEVTNLLLEFLGDTCIAQTLTYLDNGVVFAGSRMGDSQLIRLHSSPLDNGSLIEILETYTNLGPIVDMCVVDSERLGQCQLVTCSGIYKEGTLRVIRNGIGIQENATIDLTGIKGIWPLQTSSTKFDDHLVISFVGQTRTLLLNGEEVEEVGVQGFVTDSQTFWAGNVAHEQLLQITSSSCRLVSVNGFKLVSEWKPRDGKNIGVCSCNGFQVAVAVGRDLNYFEIYEGELKLVKTTSLTYDIACVDLTPLEGSNRADVCSVGLWTEISVRIYALPALDDIFCEMIGGDIIPRSILIVEFEKVPYLLVALGDGNVIYFHFNKTTGCLTDRKRVTLGTQPTILRAFKTKTSTNVFASSDRPSVIYSSNRKILFSNINLKEVTYMCPLNADAYPNSLVLANDHTLTIGTIDEIQKLHIRTVSLGETPRRICHQEQTHTFGVLSSRIHVFDLISNTHVPQRVSASTTANQLSSSSVLASLSTAGSTGVASNHLDVFSASEEIEYYSLLVMDQHTFEVYHAHSFAEREYATAVMSCKLGDDLNVYFVVGTAMVYPDEQEPKTGRLLIFQWNEGKLSQIYEREIKGAPYSMIEFNGKLLVSINSSVWLFNWTNNELKMECKEFNNILALSVKSKGDFVLVGDMMRSCKLLVYKPIETSFEEIAKHLPPNWTTTLEILDDDHFLVAEHNFNLYVCQKDSGAANEEERNQLQTAGVYHLAEFVNVLRHGSLVMENVADGNLPVSSKGVLYGSVNGAIGLICQCSLELYNQLQVLQNNLKSIIRSVGKIEHSNFRCFVTERRSENSFGFIDGDLVERLLEVEDEDDLQLAVKDIMVVDSETKNKRPATPEDMIKIVEELSRIH